MTPVRRTVLVTGGAKRLGAGIVRRLAADGHRLIIHYGSSRDAAFTLVTGQGAPDDATLVPSVERLGFARSFADVYVQQIELESVVIDRSKAANLADLGKAVTAKTGTVRISPRYGTWNAAQLSLASASATPSWLKLSPASGA